VSEAASAHHRTDLAHHFESYEQQKQSSLLGMWVFLAQEIMFFAGLFVCYVVYRHMHPAAFAFGSQHLDWRLGALNTGVLILSSFTMVVAVVGAQTGRRKMIVCGLILTLLFGAVFLGVKVVEYGAKWQHHLVPGPHFEWHGDPAAGRAVQMFFAMYFVMTGMHALHMVVGMGIMLVMIPLAWGGRWTRENHNFVEGFGLYWHFVDLVWIFLFPFLYLLGLAGSGVHG